METLLHIMLQAHSTRQYSIVLDSALQNAFPTDPRSFTQEMHIFQQ